MAVFFYKVSDPFGLLTYEDVRKAEQKLSAVQFELANRFDEPTSVKDGFGSGLGGDPFLFILSKVDLHQAAIDDKLYTAASTGKEYIWNPHYVNALSFAGLRFVIAHETQHTFLNHVPRMIKRHHSIFNKILDYFANNYAIADLKQRQNLFNENKFKENPFKDFSEYNDDAYFEFFKKAKHCKKPVLIPELKDSILFPFKSLEKAKAEEFKKMVEGYAVPPAMRRENAYKHMQGLKVLLANNDVSYYFDKSIPDNMTTPEALYDYVVKDLPVCENCSRIGMFAIPKKVNEKTGKYFKESDYPTSYVLVDIIKEAFKKHNVVLKNQGEIVPDAVLMDEKRFLKMLKEHKEKFDQQNTQDLTGQKITGLEGLGSTKVIGVGHGGASFSLGVDPQTKKFKLNLSPTAAPVIPGARNVDVDSDNVDIVSFINAVRSLKGEGELNENDKAEVEKISPDLSNKFFKEGEEPTETEKQELSAIVKKFTGLDPYAETPETPADCKSCDGQCEQCTCHDGHEPTEEEKKEAEAFQAAVDEFFTLAQDRYYAAVKKKIYFDWATIPDDIIKTGRDNPKYNETFLKSLMGFLQYIMSELSVIDKDRSIDEYFEVLKKSINNTLTGYFLIRVYMDTVYKIEQEYAADVGKSRKVNENRIIQDLDTMFNLLSGKRLSILSEFNLLGGYSEDIDMYMNPNWVNAKTIDCPHCCRKIDVFSLNRDPDISHTGGNTCSGSEEEDAEKNGGGRSKTDSQREVDLLALKNKLMNAMSYARAAGFEPAGYEELLGRLSKSHMRWQDFITSKRKEAESGGKRDYSRFKNRHLSLGLITPKRQEAFFNVYVLIDTSGSMSKEWDIERGLSQVTNLTNGRGYVICADAEVYWKDVKKLSKFNISTLSGLRVVGRGGTEFIKSFCDNFQNKMPKDAPYPDLIICITDGEFYSNDFSDLKIPKCPFMWLQTSTSNFKPSFGRVFNINNE